MVALGGCVNPVPVEGCEAQRLTSISSDGRTGYVLVTPRVAVSGSAVCILLAPSSSWLQVGEALILVPPTVTGVSAAGYGSGNAMSIMGGDLIKLEIQGRSGRRVLWHGAFSVAFLLVGLERLLALHCLPLSLSLCHSFLSSPPPSFPPSLSPFSRARTLSLSLPPPMPRHRHRYRSNLRQSQYRALHSRRFHHCRGG